MEYLVSFDVGVFEFSCLMLGIGVVSDSIVMNIVSESLLKSHLDIVTSSFLVNVWDVENCVDARIANTVDIARCIPYPC